MPKLKYKLLHKDAVAPEKGTEGSAGFDLTAVSHQWNDKYSFWEYKTGLAIEIPKGYVGYIFPRSSISKKTLSLCNSVGVIDSDYRGEISFRFKETFTPTEVTDGHLNDPDNYEELDRIGQLIIMPIPSIEFEEVEELTDTERGKNGYGHTGN